MSNEYVLDACSLIAFFNQEEGASEVKSIITKALDSGSRILMHRLNLFEVYYDLSRSSDEDKVNRAMSVINNFPVTIIDEITETLMKEAARFKLSYRISVADSFALATAKLENAMLITADHHEFDVIDEAGEIQFFWFR
jgi:predicted nucleic acid-binding protein